MGLEVDWAMIIPSQAYSWKEVPADISFLVEAIQMLLAHLNPR